MRTDGDGTTLEKESFKDGVDEVEVTVAGVEACFKPREAAGDAAYGIAIFSDLCGVDMVPLR